MQLIKKRTIKVDNMSCAGCETKITDEISKLNGIISVQAKHEAGKVFVTYDLMLMELKVIEEKLDALGYTVDRGFIYRMRDGFLRFSEENERDNFSSKPASCCSDPKDILEKAGKN